jgi:hypothetical protein
MVPASFFGRLKASLTFHEVVVELSAAPSPNWPVASAFLKEPISAASIRRGSRWESLRFEPERENGGG